MNTPCGFCNKIPEQVDHANREMFDVYLCAGCKKPDFDTRYRIVCYKGYPDILAVTVRLDEYYIILNHNFNYTTRRTKYTTIYKKVIGSINYSLDLEPITWGPEEPVCDLDFLVKLPLHDPAAVKRKLQIYTLFS